MSVRGIILCALLFVPMMFGAVMAQELRSLVVRNDVGGDLRARVRHIEELAKSGVAVEIRGRYCMSACTMYLGLARICVAPNVKFGFHGPTSSIYGISLSPQDFEAWSRIMASYYPEPIKEWFLDKGRNVTVGFYELSGADLVKLGVARCA
ncbi:hypothetical protein ACFE33_15545 (plasmid) [Falsihalocynthiibacter sp. SS001]|uniref:hypothetical protein n=1 Tax=Falsihalocynthiibacter sp. SS001 TaxID=3349698 RepID=UPI0036D416A7